MSEKRGPWYLLTGLLIGAVIGIIYSSFIAPVRYTNTLPSTLSDTDKKSYRLMVALAYMADLNLTRATARLAVLHDDVPYTTLLTNQANDLQNSQSKDAQALLALASALARNPTQTPQPVPTKQSSVDETPNEAALLPSPTETADLGSAVQTATTGPTTPPTSVASFTPRPTITVLAALTKPFDYKDKQELCDASLPQGLLQVQVEDENGEPIPGAKITVVWNEGESTFYSGLYPNINPGYADFFMDYGKSYHIRVGDEGGKTSNLVLPECTKDDGSVYAGGIWVLFTN
jgi:hypothetical protein